jgi:RHS repeat-associated protein
MNPARYYYLKDHLGSVRVTVNEIGEVISFDDYDPWGMQLNGRSNNLSDENDKYKFVGNERDIETGYDYLGHRYYDCRIGKLLSVDPFAHKDPSRSPYSYAANNPVLFYDAGGDSVWINNGDERILYSADMKTNRKDKVGQIIGSLNAMMRTKGGRRVVSDLISSTGSYNIKFDQKLKDNDGTTILGEFKANGSNLGGDILLGTEGFSLETLAHESFHAYQHNNMMGGESALAEIEAFVFQGAMSSSINNRAYNFRNDDLTHWMNTLSERWDEDYFIKSTNAMMGGAFKGYKDVKRQLPHQSTLINKLYPLR